MIQALARNKILSQTNSSLKKQTMETTNREPVFHRHHERLDAAITQQLVGRQSKQSCKIGRPRKLDAEDGTRRNILPLNLEHYCPQDLFIMAYLHCRIWTQIQTRIRTPTPMATLNYAEVFTLHRVRFRFQPELPTTGIGLESESVP